MKILGFTYKAAVYCHDCIIQQLTGTPGNGNVDDALDVYAARAGVNREDEYGFDSDDFPKIIFSYQVDNADTCDYCGLTLVGG